MDERCPPGACRAGYPDGECQADLTRCYRLCAHARRDPDLWVPSIRSETQRLRGGPPVPAPAPRVGSNPHLDLLRRADACPDGGPWSAGCGCNRRCERYGRKVYKADCLRCVAGTPPA